MSPADPTGGDEREVERLARVIAEAEGGGAEFDRDCDPDLGDGEWSCCNQGSCDWSATAEDREQYRSVARAVMTYQALAAADAVARPTPGDHANARPGPWQVLVGNSWAGHLVVADQDGHPLAVVAKDEGGADAAALADARLMAAAPDLLRAADSTARPTPGDDEPDAWTLVLPDGRLAFTARTRALPDAWAEREGGTVRALYLVRRPAPTPADPAEDDQATADLRGVVLDQYDHVDDHHAALDRLRPLVAAGWRLTPPTTDTPTGDTP